MDQNNDLDELFSTRRVVSPELEKILYEPQKVLDHGFVRVIDYMGDDSSIVQAARVSYGRGTKQVSQDKGLINYLMRHRHTTPFEMCDIKFHIKLPIFVARQWIRHRTASVNEYSARYSILGNEFYLPARENIAAQSQTNRQGRSDSSVPPEVADRVLSILKNDAMGCYDHYIDMMNEDENGNVIDENKIGITRELARMNLTLNYYTEWYWKINLHNLFHFLALRADGHAQYEIRVYAEAMLDIVKKWVPFAHEAFEEHRMHSASLSRTGLAVVKRMIAGEKVTQENSGLSKREWAELESLLS
ncbi:MAG: FAD-dependent thymidylate synthase [Rickettsiaceae bacterium]|nr:FAD-dependent thymidylate synthase [Rickettsiaceae bacterium]